MLMIKTNELEIVSKNRNKTTVVSISLSPEMKELTENCNRSKLIEGLLRKHFRYEESSYMEHHGNKTVIYHPGKRIGPVTVIALPE